jgi:DNA-binding winged helix-turn-helix (wHTH) protein
MRSQNLETFKLDLKAGELRTKNRVIRLQVKPFQILVLLLKNSGNVVTREEIRKELWPEDTIVEFDHGIGTAMKKLRRALRDDAANPRYIETLARRGYRWMAGENWVNA